MVVAVFGANGRVGKRVCELANEFGFDVVEIEKDTELSQIETHIDVAIDFSTAEATERVCDFCKAHRCPLVTGVTGRNQQQQLLIENLSKIVKVCESSNFSKGIELTKQICKILAAANWDCNIVETHRKGKADCPSGTAKDIATEILQNGTRIVQIHSLRCGSNFGKHEIVFGTNGESITIIHQAENVDIFARGALQQAKKLLKLPKIIGINSQNKLPKNKEN